MIMKLMFITNTWGLGIGDWVQSTIPNPQSPITKLVIQNKILKRK